MKTPILLIISLISLLLLFANPLFCKILSTREDALKRVFPGASTVGRQDVFLADEDVKRIEALSKTRLESRLFTFYKAENLEKIIGYAFIGTRIIRTKPAVYMVVIHPEGSVESVEILAFHEPMEYLPTAKWFDQFSGKILDENLWPRKGIHGVTGATMSVDGITQEVRMALSVFNLMVRKPSTR